MGAPRMQGIAVLALGALLSWPARAQVAEVEPNDSCAQAQAIAATGASGELVSGDVDFLRLALTPGQRYVATLRGASSGGGTLVDPILARFDPDSCAFDRFNDDRGGGRDARLIVLAPASGEVVLAAAADPNRGFVTGGSPDVGTWQLQLLPAAALSARARLVDRFSRAALPGRFVDLEECLDAACSVGRQLGVRLSESDGSVAFRNVVVTLGTRVRLRVRAEGEYDEFATRSEEVTAPAQHVTFGALPIERSPLEFVGSSGCAEELAPGSFCRFVVQVQNRRAADLTVLGWGLLAIGGSAEPVPLRVSGEAGRAAPSVYTVAGGTVSELAFAVRVPATAAPGHAWRLELFVASPTDLVNPHLALGFAGSIGGTPPGRVAGPGPLTLVSSTGCIASLHPGEGCEVVLQVQNHSADDVEVRAAAILRAWGERYLVPLAAGAAPGRWGAFRRTLPAGSTSELRFHAVIPDGAEPGGRYTVETYVTPVEDALAPYLRTLHDGHVLAPAD